MYNHTSRENCDFIIVSHRCRAILEEFLYSFASVHSSLWALVNAQDHDQVEVWT